MIDPRRCFQITANRIINNPITKNEITDVVDWDVGQEVPYLATLHDFSHSKLDES